MDYDIGVIGLANPPASAVVTSYRPAVQVRNNGIHNALASGYLRIYAAGLLIFETEVYSGTLAPGATGTADAVDYWTPPAEGTYIINGYVTTPLDQYEPNNNLGPVTIVVKGGPVPPPPTVPLHASQHEEGGTDPVNVDGLPGVLADRQPAQPHASQHQAGGDDAINVGGLAGILGDPQTPIIHGNAHHNPVMTTAAELTAHSGSVTAHTAALNLANRETTGPETGLVKGDQLALGSEVGEDPMFLARDRYWRKVTGSAGSSLEQTTDTIVITGESPETSVAELDIPDAWKNNTLGAILKTSARLSLSGSSGATLTIALYVGEVAAAYFQLPAALQGERQVDIEGYFHHVGNLQGKAHLRAIVTDQTGADHDIFIDSSAGTYDYDLEDLNISIRATPINVNPLSVIVFDGSLAFATGSPS